MTTPPTDNAAVRVFPPALYAAPLLSGVLLDRVWPLPIPARGVTAPLGAELLAAGVGLAGTWWPVAFLPLAVLAVDRLVIAREEPYLRRLFGSAYDEYCARVRRWL